MLRTRSEYVSRIGGGPDRPKRDISPEQEAARERGRGAAGGWKASEGRGDMGTAGEGKRAATKAADSSRLGTDAARQVGPLYTSWSGYS